MVILEIVLSNLFLSNYNKKLCCNQSSWLYSKENDIDLKPVQELTNQILLTAVSYQRSGLRLFHQFW